MLLEQGQKLSVAVIEKLAPYCEKIEVAGSIRRKKATVNDIDIVLIPSDPWNLRQAIVSLGELKVKGQLTQRVIYDGVQVDIYWATSKTWPTLLLIRTGSKESNMRLARLAKKRGWHLHASGSGLFNERGERIAGDTEEGIFAALGIPYQRPAERG